MCTAVSVNHAGDTIDGHASPIEDHWWIVWIFLGPSLTSFSHKPQIVYQDQVGVAPSAKGFQFPQHWHFLFAASGFASGKMRIQKKHRRAANRGTQSLQ